MGKLVLAVGLAAGCTATSFVFVPLSVELINQL